MIKIEVKINSSFVGKNSPNCEVRGVNEVETAFYLYRYNNINYDILLNIDNEAVQTVKYNIGLKEARLHLFKLLEAVPFAKVELGGKIISPNDIDYLGDLLKKGVFN